jgi:yip1 domain
MEKNNTNNVANHLNPVGTAETNPSNPTPQASAPQTKTKSNADALKQKLQEVSKNHLVNFVISALTKPTSTFKEKLSGFSDFKKAWQLPLITTGLFTILSVVNTIIAKVYTPAHKSFFGKEVAASWNWKKLDKFDWLQTIFSQIITYLVPVLAITAIYYIISLIFKKKSNYFRLLTIAAVSSIPAILTTFILMPLGTIVSLNLGFIIMFAGFAYSSILVYEGFNQDIGYQNDQRIFANTIVTITIYALAIILFTSFLKQSLGGGDLPFEALNNLFNN